MGRRICWIVVVMGILGFFRVVCFVRGLVGVLSGQDVRDFVDLVVLWFEDVP